MLKFFLSAVFVSLLFSEITLAEKVIIFNFTEEELKT